MCDYTQVSGTVSTLKLGVFTDACSSESILVVTSDGLHQSTGTYTTTRQWSRTVELELTDWWRSDKYKGKTDQSKSHCEPDITAFEER